MNRAHVIYYKLGCIRNVRHIECNPWLTMSNFYSNNLLNLGISGNVYRAHFPVSRLYDAFLNHFLFRPLTKFSHGKKGS